MSSSSDAWAGARQDQARHMGTGQGHQPPSRKTTRAAEDPLRPGILAVAGLALAIVTLVFVTTPVNTLNFGFDSDGRM